MQRRAMARQYLDDVRMAISDVQYMQEKLNRSEEKGDKITIKALYLALAGMSEQLTREQNSQFGHILNSPFAEVGPAAAACSTMCCCLLLLAALQHRLLPSCDRSASSHSVVCAKAGVLWHRRGTVCFFFRGSHAPHAPLT